MKSILRNKYSLLVFIGVLVLLNYLQWSLDEPLAQVPQAKKQDTQHIDFQALVLEPRQQHKELTAHRNVFSPKTDPKPVVKPLVKPTVKVNIQPPPPPPPTPEEIANNLSLAQLKKVQVLGIVEESGVRKAFIMYDDKSHIVQQGENFAEQLKVTTIESGKILVLDMKTNLTRDVRLKN